MKATCVAVIVAAFQFAGAARAQQCDAGAGMETNFGEQRMVGAELRSGSTIAASTWIEEPARYRYLKAYVKVPAEPGSAWQLTLRDNEFRILDVITDKSVSRAGWGWTARVPLVGQVYFHLWSDKPVTAQIETFALMPNGASNPYYSVQDRNAQKFLDITHPDVPFATRKLADSVGMLTSSWGPKGWCCSAVAIAPDAVMTNWHCGGVESAMTDDAFWQQTVCDRTSIDFSWDNDKIDREYQCVEVLQKNKSLDFAILRLAPRNRADQLVPANRWTGITNAGQRLLAIQHPACRPKQVTQDSACTVRDAKLASPSMIAGAEFSHTCDTERGSSGAPLFDDQFRLVGLHHQGFWMAEGRCDMRNKAIHAKVIFDALDPRVRKRLVPTITISEP